MASPQTEDGYTKIANELLEAFAKIRMSGEEVQVLHVILRKTYGFQKKMDKISLSQFALATGLKRPAVCRAIGKLVSKKILLIIKNDNSQINSYSINKDFDTWKPLSKKITPLSKKIIGVIKKDNLLLSKKIHTKESITKETITKENRAHKNLAPSPFVKELIAYFHDRYLEIHKQKPIINGGQDGNLLRARLKIENVDTIKSMMNVFLTSEDKFISGLSKTIGTFCSAAVFEKIRSLCSESETVSKPFTEEEKILYGLSVP